MEMEVWVGVTLLFLQGTVASCVPIRNLQIALPFGLVILLLGIYPKEGTGNVRGKEFAQTYW